MQREDFSFPNYIQRKYWECLSTVHNRNDIDSMVTIARVTWEVRVPRCAPWRWRGSPPAFTGPGSTASLLSGGCRLRPGGELAIFIIKSSHLLWHLHINSKSQLCNYMHSGLRSAAPGRAAWARPLTTRPWWRRIERHCLTTLPPWTWTHHD